MRKLRASIWHAQVTQAWLQEWATPSVLCLGCFSHPLTLYQGAPRPHGIGALSLEVSPHSPGHTTKLDTVMKESTVCWHGKKCANSLHYLPAADLSVSETHATSVKNRDNIHWKWFPLMTKIENMLVKRPGPQGVHSIYYSLLFLTQ